MRSLNWVDYHSWAQCCLKVFLKRSQGKGTDWKRVQVSTEEFEYWEAGSRLQHLFPEGDSGGSRNTLPPRRGVGDPTLRKAWGGGRRWEEVTPGLCWWWPSNTECLMPWWRAWRQESKRQNPKLGLSGRRSSVFEVPYAWLSKSRAITELLKVRQFPSTVKSLQPPLLLAVATTYQASLIGQMLHSFNNDKKSENRNKDVY